ncbi:MAG: RDD family protein [Rhizobiaceae bacterium]|nr:RDD family protein [Rhizobiaceae bacterium]
MIEDIIDNDTGARIVTPEELDGVRTARVISFFLDYIIIFLLSIPLFIVIGLLGIPTLGLAWGLLPFVPAVVALLYLATTMGGPRQATIGMAFMGIRVRKLDGGNVDPLLACLHGILFWAIHTVAVILPLLISFFSSRKRLLHNVLLGTYVGRA